MRFYPTLLTRGTKLRSLLTSIPPAQQEEIQARIIFEIQAAFVVECKDILIAELLHRKGRDQQSMNDSRPRLQNIIRRREIGRFRSDIGDMVTISGPDMERLKEIAYPPIGEEELSKMELLRGKKKNYELIWDVLNWLINGMKEGVTFHIDTMGLDNRKKSILATYHGRYHKIEIADLRAVSTDMKPIHSSGCCSTDSEVMNMVSVMDEVQRVCGENVRIYTGDAHTVSRVCAGMVFLSHGVVAAGRLSKNKRNDLERKQ